jgi:hypothetical protein
MIPSVPMRFTTYALTLMVAGCAAPAPQLYWQKADITQQEFFKDDYQCRRETSETGLQTTYSPPNLLYPSGTVTTTPSTQVNTEMYARCMAARGYTLSPAVVPVSQPTSPSNTLSQPSDLQRPSSMPAKSKPKSPYQLHFCDLGMAWDESLNQCVKMR